MKIEMIDAEVLVGTTSADLFTEIMARIPPLQELFDCYQSRCKNCLCIDKSDPRTDVYCFMHYIQDILEYNYLLVEDLLTIFEITPDTEIKIDKSDNAINTFLDKRQLETPLPKHNLGRTTFAECFNRYFP